jgi:hypothetical protein
MGEITQARREEFRISQSIYPPDAGKILVCQSFRLDFNGLAIGMGVALREGVEKFKDYR